jgi:hypothetical protein
LNDGTDLYLSPERWAEFMERAERGFPLSPDETTELLGAILLYQTVFALLEQRHRASEDEFLDLGRRAHEIIFSGANPLDLIRREGTSLN